MVWRYFFKVASLAQMDDFSNEITGILKYGIVSILNFQTNGKLTKQNKSR